MRRTDQVPKVSLLGADLASNSLVRLRPIAAALSRDFEIEVIGPLFGDGEIFPPLREEVRARVVRTKPASEMTLADYRRLWCDIGRMATGSVLFAFKPLLASFGAAVYDRRRCRRPIVLDIEDWDAAPFHQLSLRGRYGRWRLRQLFRDQGDPINTRLVELLVSRADQRIVSSSFLQRRYGGIRVMQGVNPTEFQPDALDGKAQRASLGLPSSCFLILFAGTAWPHKGLSDLVDALRALSTPNTRLVVAGRATETLTCLIRDAGDLIIYLGERPHADMPRLLAACDAVCLPQRDTPYARAQIPAKVFEAMAMGKAIVATAVSDLPEILEHCGLIAPAGDIPALAECLRSLINDTSLVTSLGRTARERCLDLYTWDTMGDALRRVIEPLTRE